MFSTAAAAQTGPMRHEWSHGTNLSLFAGAGGDGAHTGALAGAGIGWEVLPWFGLEGSGSWLDRGARAEAFAADLKAIIGLARAAAMVPFVQGGVGLYRTSFDRSRSAIPAFYTRRMGGMGPMNANVTFTDPSVVIGGGLNLFVTQHAALRPEVTSTFVIGDARTHAVTAFALRMTYHFEDHPITPSR
jgi:hypothetical protein